jgi:hypothetical protein
MICPERRRRILIMLSALSVRKVLPQNQPFACNQKPGLPLE